MIIDDEDLSPIEIAPLEIHLDLRRSLANLGTRDDLISIKESRKCFFCTCIWKENNWFLITLLIGEVR
jgi:hypothetical protein